MVNEGVREEAREAERQRIIDEEKARIAKVKALEVEKKRLATIEANRQAEAKRKANEVAKEAKQVASVPTQPSRSNNDNAGAGQAFTATFYTAYCSTGCTGVTATGLDVSNTVYTPEGLRVIAVDPAQIPLGSIVQVSLADGTVFNASAEDTGGRIQGRIVDVLVADTAEAQRLGRQGIRVHILRKGR